MALLSASRRRNSRILPPNAWLIGDLALEQGLLDAVEVDIVETLRNAGDTIPGATICWGCWDEAAWGWCIRPTTQPIPRSRCENTAPIATFTSRCPTPLRVERRNIGQLQHPNIVAAYDYGKNKGRLYLAMELVPGVDLGHYIARNGALSERLSWQIARQIAAGLAHCERQALCIAISSPRMCW